MHCLAFSAALALVVGSTQTMACQNTGCAVGTEVVTAECNSVGCVRPTNALEKLAKSADSTFSVMRVTERGKVSGLCGTGDRADGDTTAGNLWESRLRDAGAQGSSCGSDG